MAAYNPNSIVKRYRRQIILPEIGHEGQAKLRRAQVLVAGAGGLAATAMPLLAGAGVGALHVVDPDRIEMSNLHRQIFFTEHECGQPKAHILRKRCAALNSDIAIASSVLALNAANAGALVERADLVIDCADNYATSYMLSDFCLTLGKPLISASVLGLRGYVGGFCHSAPSLRAVFPDAPENAQNCSNAGVLGTLVGIAGAMQAQMALAVILGLKPSPLGQLTSISAQELTATSWRFDSAPEPKTAFPFIAPSQLTADDLIFDLRSEKEAPDLLHMRAVRADEQTLRDCLASQPGARIALCCASGLRAWRMAEKIHRSWDGTIVLVAAASG